VLVVGGGLAGLGTALRLADAGLEVTVVAKDRLTEGSSLYAQGGVAAVTAVDDSFESHIEDTLTAGAGLCHRAVVEHVVRHGPQAIEWLTRQGVEFTNVRRPGTPEAWEYHLTREGGHSHRRVLHARDATGRAVEGALESKVRAHPRIHLLERHVAIDLVTTTGRLGLAGPTRCAGLYAYDCLADRVIALAANATVLATGGASKVYLYSTNPDTSTGDGVAMAWRAGCRVANMEFIQFHPTCLYHPHAKSFLISEAVRGEGGQLVLPDGSRFMDDHDARAELAPRDIVARAIDYEMKRHGLDCVYLDISHKPAAFILEHFPTIHERCLDFGIDITRDPIPVVPAAHYTCGGIVTDLQGRTDLPGLYAVGECTFTGLHGANRLASNSLLECLVFASSAVEAILQLRDTTRPTYPPIPLWDETRVTDPDECIVVAHNWDELRRFMWDYVGIVRTTKRLQRARRRVELLREEIREYYSNFRVENDLLELRNLVVVAELIIDSALTRRESRGLHHTLDYPGLDTAHPIDTVLTPPNAVLAR